ncbi:MAG: hypothetical protein JWO56_2760 [Acidobacteria bacterium]|nr:hypothetical protein [Acidobacteriota bacterium]
MTDASRRILFVEKDESLRLLIRRVLGRYAIEADVVAEAHEAIAKLAVEKYQVVVVDLLPTDQSAYGVIRAVGLMRQAMRPVVIATGDPAADARVDPEVISLIIRKPYDVQSLADMILASIAIRMGDGVSEGSHDAEQHPC